MKQTDLALALFVIIVNVILSYAQQATIFVQCPVFTNDTATCVKVGFSYPANGSLAKEGNDMLMGYVLWAENVNTHGGILQKMTNRTVYVQLMGYNDQSNSVLTNASYTRLITVDSVDYLLGPYGTSFSQVANAVTDRLGKFIVFGSASGEDLFTKGYTKIFSVSTTTTHYTDTAVPLLKTLGVTTAAIALADTTFTADVLLDVLGNFNDTGIQLLGNPMHYPNTTRSGISSVLPSIQQLNPDVFFSFVLLADGPTVVSVAKQIGFKPKAFYMTSSPSDPQSVKSMGVDAEYLMGPSQWHPSLTYGGEVFGTASDYVNTFRARFNVSDPSFTVVQASASGVALQTAIRDAVSTSHDDVLASLRTLNVVTFYGPIAFDSAGRNRLKSMVTTQVFNGTIEVVAPSNFKTIEAIYPIPGSAATAISQSTVIQATTLATNSAATKSSITTQDTQIITSHSLAQNKSSPKTVLSNGGAIAIAVLGAAVLFAALGALMWYALYRRRKFNRLNDKPDNDMQEVELD